MTLIATIVVLSVVIFVHELGHLMAAKWVDIEVPRFSIGFGPKLAGFRIGETEYILSALPLGGYVRMAGLEEGAELEGGREPEREAGPRDFEAKPLWARILVISAGVLMNLLFAILVFIGLNLAYGQEIDPTTRVIPRVAATQGENAAALAAIPRGAELIAVGSERVDNRNEIARTLLRAPSGPLVLQFANAAPVTVRIPASDSGRVVLLDALAPQYPSVIGQVVAGSPAAAAGLRADDRVLAVDGEAIASWPELVEIVRASAREPLELQIDRGGRRLSVTVTPELETEPGFGEIGRVGIGPQRELIHRSLSPGEAVTEGLTTTWDFVRNVVRFLGNLFSGDESPRSVGSVLTIGQISGEAARLGAEPFLRFLAFFSINLAVLNLLPIPILDGGHLLFLSVEAVRGRPISLEQRLRLSHVGLIIVVGIMVWALTNDVLRALGI